VLLLSAVIFGLSQVCWPSIAETHFTAVCLLITKCLQFNTLL